MDLIWSATKILSRWLHGPWKRRIPFIQSLWYGRGKISENSSNLSVNNQQNRPPAMAGGRFFCVGTVTENNVAQIFSLVEQERDNVSVKKVQKKRAEPSKNKNIHWQMPNGYDMMIFHTVVVCPFMDIRSNMVILAQMGVVVKMKVVRNWQLRQAYQKHIIRKKGCDDPYGNGQGRNVRQDHA